jgi:phosphoglycolate phosphatase
MWHGRLMNRLAVFDLDGTLLDTAPDIRVAVNRRLAAAGLPPLGLDAVSGMIGDGARVLLERAFAARGAAVPDGAVAAFTADPDLEGGTLTRLFPGITTLLEQLTAEGWRLAVCTNKPVGPARAVLAHFGVAGHFRAVCGGDSFATRKPDPAHLLGTMGQAGGGRALMIGDHSNDMLAARGAGVEAIFAGWGYGPAWMAGDNPVAEEADAVLALLTGGA